MRACLVGLYNYDKSIIKSENKSMQNLSAVLEELKHVDKKAKRELGDKLVKGIMGASIAGIVYKHLAKNINDEPNHMS